MPKLFNIVNIVCAVSIAASVGFGYHLVLSHKRCMEQAETTLLGVVRVLEQHASSSLFSSDLLLRRIVLLSRRQLDGPAASEDMHRVLADMALISPAVGEIFVINTQGIVVADSRNFPPRSMDSSASDYYYAHKDGDGDGLFISRSFKGRLTGKAIFAMSRRITGADGSFKGVVAVAIDTWHFQKLYEGFGTWPGLSAGLFTADGDLLVRYPYSEKLIGISASHFPLFSQHLLKSNEGVFVREGGFDPSYKMIAYRKVARVPVVVTAALDYDEVVREWRSNALIEGAVLVTLCMTTLICGIAVSRVRRGRHRPF